MKYLKNVSVRLKLLFGVISISVLLITEGVFSDLALTSIEIDQY